jgi:sensor domain CHASE-containing protein
MELVTVVLPAVAVIVWLIRLEGRVNTQEALQERVVADITYIRSRIDTALNGHHKDHG